MIQNLSSPGGAVLHCPDSAKVLEKFQISSVGRSQTSSFPIVSVTIIVFAALVILAGVHSLFVIFGDLPLEASKRFEFNSSSPAASSASCTAAASSSPATASVGGSWLLSIKTAAGPISSGMCVFQRGNSFSGYGKDKHGRFQVENGVRKDRRVHFEKRYLSPNGAPVRSVIYFDGLVLEDVAATSVQGNWCAFPNGVRYYRGYERRIGGTWEGQIAVDVTASSLPVIPETSSVSLLSQDASSRISTNSGFANSCLFVSVLIFAIGGVGFLYVSQVFFGPNGKVNILEKQKYIPSQFLSQHKSVLNVLAQPTEPGSLPLGDRLEWRPWYFWTAKSLALTPAIRKADPHMLIVGARDTGKSRLMCNMIVHDIKAQQRAVIVIDSDGELVDSICLWLASQSNGDELSERVLLVDPTNPFGCPGFNPLEIPNDGDLKGAAASIVYAFKAIFVEPPNSQSQWSQQTANILRNAAMLLMATGHTLADLPSLLNDNDFRDVLLDTIQKEKGKRAEYISLLETWSQYKRLARTEQWINWVEPILNRIGPLLSDDRLRSVLVDPVSELDLKDAIHTRKIILVKIPKARLDEGAKLFGAMIVTAVKQAALAEVNAGSRGRNVALYLDEVDNFIEKDTLQSITNETAKFRIGVVGTIKTLQHLPQEFRQELVLSFGTLACFALAKADGDLLGPQMFRVDGRKMKFQTIQNFFNKVNTSPQFEYVSDEEKLNIDRVVGQEPRTFFCYRMGSVAGVFHLISHEFVANKQSANKRILTKIKERYRTSPDGTRYRNFGNRDHRARL